MFNVVVRGSPAPLFPAASSPPRHQDIGDAPSPTLLKGSQQDRNGIFYHLVASALHTQGKLLLHNPKRISPANAGKASCCDDCGGWRFFVVLFSTLIACISIRPNNPDGCGNVERTISSNTSLLRRPPQIVFQRTRQR